MSAEDALKKYFERQEKKLKGKYSSRKNNRPEKDVEKEILTWAKRVGMDLHVIESKATYSAHGGYYGSAVAPGFPDLVGNYNNLVCYIELKAKGRRSTVRPKQFLFLEEKIKQSAFACVTDSVKHLEKLFSQWLNTPETTHKIDILLNDINKIKPKILKDDDGGLFDE